MDRKRQGAQFEESAAARDIDQAIKGAYPPDYLTGSTLSANMPITIFTTPQGIWRVILHLYSRCSNTTVRDEFQCVRDGVAHHLKFMGIPETTFDSQIPNLPLTFKPFDALRLVDNGAVAGVAHEWTVAYIDVPIPGGGEPCFKPGRRG